MAADKRKWEHDKRLYDCRDVNMIWTIQTWIRYDMIVTWYDYDYDMIVHVMNMIWILVRIHEVCVLERIHGICTEVKDKCYAIWMVVSVHV